MGALKTSGYRKPLTWDCDIHVCPSYDMTASSTRGLALAEGEDLLRLRADHHSRSAYCDMYGPESLPATL